MQPPVVTLAHAMAALLVGRDVGTISGIALLLFAARTMLSRDRISVAPDEAGGRALPAGVRQPKCQPPERAARQERMPQTAMSVVLPAVPVPRMVDTRRGSNVPRALTALLVVGIAVIALRAIEEIRPEGA